MKIILNLIFLFMLACSNFSNSQVETNIYVKPIMGTGVFEDYFYTEKFVPLETNEKCLIGTLSLIRETKSKDIVVISNWHQSSVEVLLFSKNGEFLTKIGEKGQGPEEYNSVIDVCVDENDYIYILDSRKILIYNAKGNFIKNIRLNFYSSGLFVINGWYFFTKEYNYLKEKSFYTLLKVNNKGEVCGEFMKNDPLLNFKTVYCPTYPYDSHDNHISLLEFYRQSVKIFSTNDNSFVFYTFEEDSCNDNKYVRDFMEKNIEHVVPRTKREKVFKKLHRFNSAFLLDNDIAFLLTNFWSNKKGEILLLDLKTHTCVDTGISMWDMKENATEHNLLPYIGFGIIGKHSNGFITVCEDFEYLEKNKKKLGFSEDIHFSANSNPVLCFVTLKNILKTDK